MCTVIVSVPDRPGSPVRLLAVRDEDPGRAWDAPGAWWPVTYPGVIGIRDTRAGGAWLAAAPDERRLAVLLNRAEQSDVAEDGLHSRGTVVLESVAGRPPGPNPPTHGFNLVAIEDATVRVTTWDGVAARGVELAAGTHMIAHEGVDDAATPRIATWLAPFAEAHSTASGRASDDWFAPWLTLLERSAQLAPTDDQAIIRDNRAHGYPTLSLLACTATIGADGVQLRYGAFDQPGRWNHLDLT